MTTVGTNSTMTMGSSPTAHGQRENKERDAEPAVVPPPPSPSTKTIASASCPVPRASTAPRRDSPGPPPGTRGKARATNLFIASGEPSTPASLDVLAPRASLRSKSDLGYVEKGNGIGRSVSLKGKDEKKGFVVGETASSSTSSVFGASLRRTLTEVKRSGLALKRSISGRYNNRQNIVTTEPGTMTRHGRSLSESPYQEDAPMNAHAHAQGSGRHSRRGATLPLSPDISEASPSDSIKPSRMDGDVKVPLLLQEGTPMTKVSAKKKKTVIFRIDPDQGYVLWESKKSGVIPIENIKEIRSGADARYYREQFQLSQEYESRWLTLVYIADGRYKTLHAVATTPDVFHLWDRTLRALHAVRQELMSGLGHVETRQSVWEKRYWRGADEHRDDRLSFEEVEKMCRRLNLNFSKEELRRRFEEADMRQRGYLDFDDFRKFVRLLKERPEIDRLYKKLVGDGPFDFKVFEKFMRTCQKSTVSLQELETTFRKYVTSTSAEATASAAPPEVPRSPPPSAVSPSSSVSPTSGQRLVDARGTTPPPSGDSKDLTPSSTAKAEATSEGKHRAASSTQPLSSLILTLDGFINFLLSTDNSAFADQNGKIWQDMTRPLPEYYISSSHNTYLVGHQLVGDSTIEGYIRALLHSCRTVEIDIYDGETEPVIYHGKTLTSKVALRDICQAIAKYAFVASPYPVIISAEVHCSVAQQDLVASIMRSVFGDALVSAPPEGRPVITQLPSPEDLKGCVLLKAKNLYVTEQEGLKEKKVTVDAESSESSTSSSSASESSASESEGRSGRDRGVGSELKRSLSKARNVDAVKEIKEELSKARSLYDRVLGKKPSSPPREGASSLPITPSRPATFPSTSTLGDGNPITVTNPVSLSVPPPPTEKTKVKMSLDLLTLLVYTVGVKCRGFNKKETYAPEHMFSLSERTANKLLKQSVMDLIKHNRMHLVRIYPKGLRFGSSNYEPHRYWAAGAQLVAINWQTFDLGYMINHSMFQRNGRAGYVLKPAALRLPNYKELLAKRTSHLLDLTIISAQQLPRRKDSEGREVTDGSVVDPYVEVSIHVPDWTRSPYTSDSLSVSTFPPGASASVSASRPPNPQHSSSGSVAAPSPAGGTARVTTVRTGVVKNNGFNPVWEESLFLPFECVGDMFDLIFLRIAVRDERDDASDEPIAVYCVSLGSLQQGYRHLPLHDAQLSQYLFSSLFVQINIRDV